MTRAPFEKYTARLVGEVQRESAIARLKSAPIDPKKPLEMILREEVKTRGLDANGYYWLRLGEIAEQACNSRYNSDCWHEYAKRNIMEEEVTNKDGIQISKWTELPDGTLTVISTTQLEKVCFANYVTMIEAFGANLGVRFSANPRDK